MRWSSLRGMTFDRAMGRFLVALCFAWPVFWYVRLDEPNPKSAAIGGFLVGWAGEWLVFKIIDWCRSAMERHRVPVLQLEPQPERGSVQALDVPDQRLQVSR